MRKFEENIVAPIKKHFECSVLAIDDGKSRELIFAFKRTGEKKGKPLIDWERAKITHNHLLNDYDETK